MVDIPQLLHPLIRHRRHLPLPPLPQQLQGRHAKDAMEQGTVRLVVEREGFMTMALQVSYPTKSTIADVASVMDAANVVYVTEKAIIKMNMIYAVNGHKCVAPRTFVAQ